MKKLEAEEWISGVDCETKVVAFDEAVEPQWDQGSNLTEKGHGKRPSPVASSKSVG